MTCHDVLSPARNTPLLPQAFRPSTPRGSSPEGLATESGTCDSGSVIKVPFGSKWQKCNSGFGSLTFGNALAYGTVKVPQSCAFSFEPYAATWAGPDCPLLLPPHSLYSQQLLPSACQRRSCRWLRNYIAHRGRQPRGEHVSSAIVLAKSQGG
uniref:Uncharacterized protein n=1 Tax=Myotis myotis TaxID=51298 RepID=A0A7J7RDJ2_MYOMY|nr:hypothetical protein mMyoMyo1_010380 [Myotis myotis]